MHGLMMDASLWDEPIADFTHAPGTT